MRRSLGRTFGAALIAFVSAVLTITTLTLLALAFRLAAGPVPISGVAPIAERAISAALAEAAPGWRATLDDFEIRRDPGEDGLGLRLVGLTLLDPEGAEALSAPEIALAIDAAAALRGDFKVTSISLSGGEAALRRDERGAFGFALAPAASADALTASIPAPAARPAARTQSDAAPVRSQADRPADEDAHPLMRLIEAWSGAAGGDGPIAALRRVTVRDAAIAYQDDLTGSLWRAPSARLDFTRPLGGGLALTVDAEIDFGQGAFGRVLISAERPATARPAAQAQSATPQGRLSARFDHAPIAAIAAQAPGLAALRDMRGFVSGEAEATIALDTGAVLAATASLRGEGADFRRLAGPGHPAAATLVSRDQDPLALSAFEADFDYAPAEDALRLRRFAVMGDRMTAALSGEARLKRDAARRIAGAEGRLAIDSALISDPTLFGEPLVVEGGGFAFRLKTPAASAPSLALDGLTLTTPAVEAAGALAMIFEAPTGLGALDSVGGAIGARADVELTLSAFRAEALAPLWPLPAAPGGRAWVARNIRGGVIEDARFIAKIGGGLTAAERGAIAAAPPASAPTIPPANIIAAETPTVEREIAPEEIAPTEVSNAGETTVAPLIEGAPRETIDLAFRFRNLESSYLAEMTPITGGAGSATLDATRFDLTVESAQVDLGEAGALELGGSRFAIPDFAPRIPPSEIEIRSRGPIRALLALIDQEPLGFPSKLGLDPATARGEVDGVTRLALPLAKDLPMDAVSIAADGALTKISLPVAQLEGARASAETAELEVDAEGLRLRAEARLEGIEEHLVWVDWRERFAPEAGEARTRLAIASTITAAEFDAMGAPPEFGLSGSARLTGGLDVVDDQPIAIRAALRLDRLGFTDPYLGWSKTAGQEARIEASGRFDSESAGWRLDRLTAAGPGLAATGAARLAADGAFRSLSLASLTVDDRIDASINLTRDAEGISINGRGAKFDVSELLGASASSADAASGDEAQSDEAARASAAQAEEPRLALDLAFDRVTLGEGAELTAMRLAASRSPSGRLYADLTATAGEGVVSASVRPIDDSPRRRYRLETNNLGQLLQASGQINAAERGAAVITAEERADGAVKGDLTARGLVVRDAPVLADILSIASVVGIFDLASSGGITFTQINGPFTYREGVLTLGEMAAVGPSLGLTLEGTVDFRRDQLDLDGSVTPAFVINGLPGQVPIIGDLLTGGEGQGVLGVSFTMRGPIEDFKVSVDPLSAVMPGPLRRLRRLFTD